MLKIEFLLSYKAKKPQVPSFDNYYTFYDLTRAGYNPDDLSL